MRRLICFFMRLSLAPLNSTAMAEDPAIAQDDLGLLHGTFTRVTKPVQEHDFSGFGQVGQFLVTPDGRRVVFHQTTEDDKNNFLDRVVAMDVATAKVEKVLDEAKGIAEIRMPMQITEDGKGLLMGESDGVDVYDLAAGTLVKHYEAPKDQTVTWVAFSSDSKEVVGGTEDGGALVWKLGTDKPAYIKLDLPKESSHAAFPLTGRDDLLVVVRPRSEGAKTRITLVDPKTMKATLLTEFEGNVDVRPTSDGKRVYVFRQEDPGEVVWTSIEEWDLQTAKMSSKRPLKPPLSSIGLKLSQDGNTLFLHEYLAQPVIMWDLKQGKFLASVAPEMGGCQAFDTTPDGKQLVAVVGQWIQGTLVPQKLAVYDTSALVSGAGMSKK